MMDEQLTQWSAHVPGWVWNLSILIIALLTGFLIKGIIAAMLRFYRKHKDYSFFRSLLTHTGKSLNYFLPLLMLSILMPFARLIKPYEAAIGKIVDVFFISAFAGLLISSIKVFEDYVYHTYDLNKSDNLKERKVRTQLQFIRKVLVSLIILISLAIILLSFDNVRKIGAGLLTGVGIGGIIIGFAAQKSLGNFLAGFQIAFTQPIRIDDVLVVEGEWGRVEDITFTYVVLSIWDQRRLILPITYFIEKPFQNWTRTTSEILGTVFLYVDYTVPVDELRTELTRLLKGSALWDKRVGIIQVTDTKESGTIELRVLLSAANASDAFDLRCFVRENLLKFIQQKYPAALPKTRIMLTETHSLHDKHTPARADT